MKPHLTRGWFKIGSRPVVKTVYEKKRISVFGALSENEFSAQMTEERCNYQSYLRFLKSLMRKYGKVLIVIDGAKYHFEKEHVQSFYKDNEENLKVIQLPAYSPELNPIEQTWKKTKKWMAITIWATKEEFEMKIAEALNKKEFMTQIYEYYMP